VIGIASQGETFSLVPVYPCCNSRGSVVAFDALTGKLKWQTYMISEAEAAQGSSGASVWVTPTYDSEANRVYVATGNNFSGPATGTSDAVLALDAASGKLLWKNQLHANDVWNYQYPLNADHPDYDFGDSPQVFRLRNGKNAVGVGQKSGFFHLLDADTGALLDNIQPEVGGVLGGLFADSAYANGVTYANGINWAGAGSPQVLGSDPGPRSGDVFAIRSDQAGRLRILWSFHTEGSPNLSGVAVANGIVYFHSSASGVLHALDAAKGTPLRWVNVGAGASGPSISNGYVYLGTGDTLSFIVPNAQTGTITALTTLPLG
jgi:polyvinyl alcohol dehydrogenase (cytochrome)